MTNDENNGTGVNTVEYRGRNEHFTKENITEYTRLVPRLINSFLKNVHSTLYGA